MKGRGWERDVWVEAARDREAIGKQQVNFQVMEHIQGIGREGAQGE